MLVQVTTTPALLGARRKSGCGHWWWWSFTRAQILNSLYAKLVAKEHTLTYIMSNLDIISVYERQGVAGLGVGLGIVDTVDVTVVDTHPTSESQASKPKQHLGEIAKKSLE